MRNLLFSVVLMAVSAPIPAFAATKFLCTNRESFPGPVLFTLNVRTASLSYKTAKCPLVPMDYKPISAKYEGWKRFGSTKAGQAGCTKLGSAIADSKEKVRFEWISFSKEMQGGADGFAQFGYENIWDPGSGGTAKVFVRCRATN